MEIQYIALDPRPASQASEIEKLQGAKSEGFYLLGLEVTVPALAMECHENIDPQHTDRKSNTACISIVFTRCQYDEILPLPMPKKLLLVTIRPDLDSIGSMALIRTYLKTDSNWMRFHHPEERIQQIAAADCFLNSGKWEKRELFSSGFEQTNLAALARATSDFKIPLQQRVDWVVDWLDTGAEPTGYRQAYEKEHTEIQNALLGGETQVQVRGSTALVKSKLRAATSIGYAYAPVVVAFNPEMPSPAGPYSKFTICQYAPGYCDISAALKALAELEPGWGGSSMIGGSPQGVSSSLAVEQVVDIVLKHCHS